MINLKIEIEFIDGYSLDDKESKVIELIKELRCVNEIMHISRKFLRGADNDERAEEGHIRKAGSDFVHGILNAEVNSSNIVKVLDYLIRRFAGQKVIIALEIVGEEIKFKGEAGNAKEMELLMKAASEMAKRERE
ncbi:MAG: hypothetical protein HC919_07475 [Oscillatoriales cyanobacterium SM2_2_1]|nr:hypothetical protein [Oscillatoriales cyanobacterium SM2_2_1]